MAEAAPKKRPDARPMRLVLGASALAGLSAVATGLIRPPATEPVTGSSDTTTEVLVAPKPEVRVVKRIRYVRLAPGEHAPPGARVIREAAPTPRVVVTTVRDRQPAVVRRVVVRTRQSGG
jgi:hypothetical protein